MNTLARVIRVFPRRTRLTPRDDNVYIGGCPMFIKKDIDEVHISCTFTWDKDYALQLQEEWGHYYPTVKIGGPAFDTKPDGFIPGMYLRKGVTFTSRGCNNKCPFCLVRKREGKLIEYDDFPEGYIIQDNNLTQCSKPHQRKVFSMLRTQRNVELSGGIEAREVDDEFAEEVRSLRLSQLFLACDYPEALKPLKTAIKALGLSQNKLRCYVLLAYDGQTLDQANWILREVWNAGAMPFAMLYQPPDSYIDYLHDYREWHDLQRAWARPPAMRSIMKKEIGSLHR
jgi:hypothetical protein